MSLRIHAKFLLCLARFTLLALKMARASASPLTISLYIRSTYLLLTVKSSPTVSRVLITKSCPSIHRQKQVMSASGGTYRGTPNRGQNRAQVPTFENNPSNIPRPKLESHASSAMQSDCAISTLSASRQKQSKRDEVFGVV